MKDESGRIDSYINPKEAEHQFMNILKVANLNQIFNNEELLTVSKVTISTQTNEQDDDLIGLNVSQAAQTNGKKRVRKN